MKTHLSSLRDHFKDDEQGLAYLEVAPYAVIDCLGRILACDMDDTNLALLEQMQAPEMEPYSRRVIEELDWGYSMNWLISEVSLAIAETHPNTASQLLTRLNFEFLYTDDARMSVHRAYDKILNQDGLKSACFESVIKFLKIDVFNRWDNSSLRNNSPFIYLLGKSYQAINRNDDGSLQSMRGRCIEMGVDHFTKFDNSASLLRNNMIKAIEMAEDTEAGAEVVQDFVSNKIDPAFAFLSACASQAPVFGPALENMLRNINSLCLYREKLMATGNCIDSIVCNGKAFAGLLINAFSLDYKKLSKEMEIPDYGVSYPFAWQNEHNVDVHPVVDGLKGISSYLQPADDKNREEALTNLFTCLVSWCGKATFPDDPERPSFGIKSNKHTNKAILDILFTESRCLSALDKSDEKSASVLYEYIMDNHKALRSLVPNLQKGRHLSNDLGI